MANSPQLLLAGQTYFVIVENKTTVTGFYDDACYRYYLLHLLNCLNNYQIKLHAYVLMANEIWLLATPGVNKPAPVAENITERAIILEIRCLYIEVCTYHSRSSLDASIVDLVD